MWYHPNGAVAARGAYLNGELHGPFRTWDVNGAELPVEQWDHGTCVSGPGEREVHAIRDAAPAGREGDRR